MGRRVAGTLNGTGAAVRVGIGFIPDWLKLWNLEDDGGLAVALEWSITAGRSIEQEEGILLSSDAYRVELVNGAGVAPYRARDVFGAAQTAYLEKDIAPDKRALGAGSTIADWTLTTSGSRTGKFDQPVLTSAVGEGSLVTIRESGTNRALTARMVALSNDGDADDDITLSEDVKTGTVLFLGGMYDYIGLAAGNVMKDGFVINETGKLNTSGELIGFEAGKYD